MWFCCVLTPVCVSCVAEVVGILVGVSVVVLVTSPLLLLASPCILCCVCKPCVGSKMRKRMKKKKKKEEPSQTEPSQMDPNA